MESLPLPALKIASGLVHKLPPDLGARLASDVQAFEAWEDSSSIARSEWICWIESAKKVDTRIRRIERATNWQQHSVRGFLAGTVKKKLGFTLTSKKADGELRRYRIEARRGR